MLTTTPTRDRIRRRLAPLLEAAAAGQPSEVQAIATDADTSGRSYLTYSTEPARVDQPGRWVTNIAWHVVDHDGDERILATVAGTLVGLVAAGDYPRCEHFYLPDETWDPDLGPAPIELDPATDWPATP